MARPPRSTVDDHRQKFVVPTGKAPRAPGARKGDSDNEDAENAQGVKGSKGSKALKALKGARAERPRSWEELYAMAKNVLARELTSESLKELVWIRKQLAAMSAKGRQDATPATARPGRAHVPYPSLTDPRFQESILSKKEFAQHALSPVQLESRDAHGVNAEWGQACSQREFRLTPTQLFLKDYFSPLTPYNSLLLFHGVGVGKTCSAVTIAENFKGRRALVLVNPGLQDNFRKEIFDGSRMRVNERGSLDIGSITRNQCVATAYMDRIEDKHMLSLESIERRVSKLIAQKYTFMGPRQFANYVMKLGDGDAAIERIKSRFSGMLMIVDEAHHLRNATAKPQADAPADKEPAADPAQQQEKMVVPALRKVLQYADDVKLLLMTATPMFNDARDLLELVNLMLINDRRQRVRASDVFDRSGKITPDGKRVLLENTRGYVSYMRGENPFSFPLRLAPHVNSDPLVLKPSKLPRQDVKGDRIPAGDGAALLTRLSICASGMSGYQAKIYAAYVQELVEALNDPRGRPLDDEAADVLDEAEDGTVDADADAPAVVKNRRSMLLTGLQICNIVFPSSIPGAPRHGINAMMNCFDKTSSKPLQLAYKPGVPQFLRPGAADLGAHAPKMHAILERVLKAEGIVFVYSRFNWMGLIPLAMALEHVGFDRYNGRNILSGGAAAPRKKPLKYTMLCGTSELTWDATGDVQAARQPANIDGSVIKVILASEFATEGIDLRYVREVHILDPWYHLNKVEQIFGRASRYCSHADLPLEKRNVTLYMHAALGKDTKVETIDLRAYRIAAAKQERMAEVESLVISNSIDCALNLPRLQYDRAALAAHIRVETSQGTVIPRHAVGDDPNDVKWGRRVTCRASASAAGVGSDASTFSFNHHAHNVDDYIRVIVDKYCDPEQPIFDTLEGLEMYARGKMIAKRRAPSGPGGFKRELLMLALDRMLILKTPLQRRKRVNTSSNGGVGDDGREEGYLVYRGDKYMFQPASAHSLSLTLEERENYGEAFARQTALLRLRAHSSTAAADASGTRDSQPHRASAAAAAAKRTRSASSLEARPDRSRSSRSARTSMRWNGDDPIASIEKRVTHLLMRLPAHASVLMQGYGGTLIDCVVDRLKTNELLDACKAALKLGGPTNKAAASSAHAVGMRLEAAGTLFRKHPGYCYDPTTRGFFCLDDKAASWAACAAIQLQDAAEMFRKHHANLEPDIRKYAGYVGVSNKASVMANASQGNFVFKIVGSSKGSEGCICYQTSSVTVSDMIHRINKLDRHVLDGNKKGDKRALCELYELLLRKKLPAAFLRPAGFNMLRDQALSATV